MELWLTLAVDTYGTLTSARRRSKRCTRMVSVQPYSKPMSESCFTEEGTDGQRSIHLLTVTELGSS